MTINNNSNIYFVTKTNNNFYKIELSKTIIHFMEYDFTYFWEQAIELGQFYKDAGGYMPKQASIVKNLIGKCHPYFEAQINSDFEQIVLDCIIEYICQSESLSLEELWVRCIAPKSLYEKAIFSRISEYKIHKGINQWANLVMAQDYARQKISFIFDGTRVSKDIYSARRSYFDLTFSVLAKELGYPSDDLPSVKRYNPALMPNAPFALSRVSKNIFRDLNDIIEAIGDKTCLHIPKPTRDQVSMDLFQHIRDMQRPDDAVIKASEELFRTVSQEVFMPESFKAVIDLEIDKMIENDLLLQCCEKCGKYFLQELQYVGQFCNRVNASGLTCREQELPAHKQEDQPSIPHELEERCIKVADTLSSRINDGLEEREVREWLQYLQNMKENVQNQFSTLTDLESFLDYSEKMASDSMLGLKLRNPPTQRRRSANSTHSTPALPRGTRDDPAPYEFPVLDLNDIDEQELLFSPSPTRIRRTAAANAYMASQTPQAQSFDNNYPQEEDLFKPFSPQNLEHIQRPQPKETHYPDDAFFLEGLLAGENYPNDTDFRDDAPPPAPSPSPTPPAPPPQKYRFPTLAELQSKDNQ